MSSQQLPLPLHRPTVMGRAERVRPRHRPSRAKQLGFVGAALLSSAFAFATVVYGYRWLMTSEVFQLSDVRINGNQHASTEELLRYLNLAPGESTLALNLDVLKANLLTHPWVKSVEIERMLPSTISIAVSEHEAAGVVALGSMYVVDAAGEVFAHAQMSELQGFSPITGLSPDWLDNDPGEWHRLLALALSFQDAAVAANLSLGEIHVDEALGVSAQILPNGVQAAFGRGDFAGKIARLKKTRALLQQQNKTAESFLLDNARHPDWVIARLSKTAAKSPYGAR